MKLILVGGFLGSGKTTAIAGACDILINNSTKVAVITNDQGVDQVDSKYLSALGIPGAEVLNGCFCCNFDKLNEELSRLIDIHSPDVVFAETVGSCTDLVATVAKPFEKFRSELDIVISVFVDIELLAAIVEERALFIDESVRYIFKKQIEEADVLILNKSDCAAAESLTRVGKLLTSEYPEKILLVQNSHESNDVSNWVQTCLQMSGLKNRLSLEIDYETYGKGERELSWGDQLIEIESNFGDAVIGAEHLIGEIFDSIQEKRLPIGHLKFLVRGDNVSKKISFTTMSTSADVRLGLSPTNKIEIQINARVQSSPEQLAFIIESAIGKIEARFRVTVTSNTRSFFRPGYPKPTHRL